MRYLILCLLLWGGSACAQGFFSGYLKDTNGEPLIGAHVINLRSEMGMVTDVRGVFRMDVQVGDTLKMTHVGYQPHHVIVEAAMINRSLKITLTASVTELSSVIVFAEVNYRVPRRFRPQPLKIEGLAREVSKPPIKAGSIRALKPSAQSNEIPMFGAGVVLYGPLTFFTAAQKEIRKAERAAKITSETLTYQQFVNQPDVRDSLMVKYELTTETLNQFLVTLNQKNTGVEVLTNEKELWNSLSLFIESQLNRTSSD